MTEHTVSATAPDAKLAIIAGGGELPLRLADACAMQNRPFHIIGLKGMADASIERYPHDWSWIGTVGTTLSILRDRGCTELVMGGIVKRPDFSSLKLDLTGTRLLPRVAKAARGGDDQLLRVLVSFFEEKGFRVVGADEVMARLLAGPDRIAGDDPSDENWRDIDQACEVVEALGRLDVGQGAVVARGLVLAVEAAEGTDAMLRRCLELPEHIRGSPEEPCGVLVKLSKPGQERRIDLPTIGAQTIEACARAGLAGIAVEAGGALILDLAAVRRAAEDKGLFVIGIDRGAGARHG